LHCAALEWSLAEPIVINAAADIKSRVDWQDRVAPFHHQVQNLMRFCRRLPVTLLADDVGLGKTISAGLIISELMKRNRISKVFVVCPKILIPQWVEELEAKFGIKAYGVHVNGYVRRRDAATGKDATLLWVARRSAAKPTWPGKLDHIVAGGQPHGLSLAANVVKECQEEAGIPAALAAAAAPVGAVSYTALQPVGLKRDVLFCYDLELPQDFVPEPQDGEVAEFFLMTLQEVAAAVAAGTPAPEDTGAYKDNCNLVVIDFLIRHGALAPDAPGYLGMVRALRSGDCS
jgi:8-oxo-dGTP pyrophosphatase MutT (NUDIX family)